MILSIPNLAYSMLLMAVDKTKEAYRVQMIGRHSSRKPHISR